MFATLDEHSKKFKEFGARHEKDTLRIMSKLEVANPEGCKHMIDLINADEEHKKGVDVKLKNAKRIINVYCESSFP